MFSLSDHVLKVMNMRWGWGESIREAGGGQKSIIYTMPHMCVDWNSENAIHVVVYDHQKDLLRMNSPSGQTHFQLCRF